MKRRLLIYLLCFVGGALWAQTPIGTWRTHHSYSQLHAITYDGCHIYGAAPKAIVCYEPNTDETTTLSRSSGLSEASIATIAYDTNSRCLVVAYTSSNIDLIQDKCVYNLSDIVRADIDGGKNIHHIRFYKGFAWLCCDFGLVQVDLARHEVANTLYLGSNTNHVAIYDIAFTNDSMVAATSRGLMYIALDDPYPNIASRWHCESTLISQNEVPISIVWFDQHLYCLTETFQPDSLRLYRYNSNNYQVLDSGSIQAIHATPQALTVCKWSSVSIYRAMSDTAINLNDSDYWTGMANNDAVTYDGQTLWIAHNYFGLIAIEIDVIGNVITILPSSPLNNDNVYRLNADKNCVLLAPGGKRTTFENLGLPAQVCGRVHDGWVNIHDPAFDTLTDVVEAIADPFDPTHIVAASWGQGLVDIRNWHVTAVYNESNSNQALQPYRSGNYRSLRTGGVAFDKKGNLWATNSLSRYGLVCLGNDGRWTPYDTYNMVGSNEIDHVLCDSVRNFVWFYGKANLIYVHDGERRMAYVDPNNGSKKTTSSVNCVAQDHKGDLWLGTNGGIKVIYDGYKAFSNGGNGEKSPVTCSNIIIDNGEFVEYLMAYENVSCIAVDGANRKWIGTMSGGLYLISDNGQEELLHFTTQNSPLLSNRILSLAIHPRSGEIFIGTDQGLISYHGTATYATTTPDDDIHAYPNPVEPDYEGPIAIKGFTRNALVHITDAAGHVVYSTRALGGQAIWYGRTNSGTRVASGVYYVFASDEEKGNRSVTKILVIR